MNEKSTENIMLGLDGFQDTIKVDENSETKSTNSKQELVCFVLKICCKILPFAVAWGYFIWATYYYLTFGPDESLCGTTCTGYGFLLIIFCMFNYGYLYAYILKPYVLKSIYKSVWLPTASLLKKINYGSIIFYIIFFGALLIYLIVDNIDDPMKLMPLAGLALFMFVAFCMCPFKRKIQWNTVIWGLILQFSMGLLTIKWDTGRNIFDCAGDKVNTFLNYAQNGSAFVYGEYLVYEKGVFAFTALSTIFFLSFVINILYHYGIMQAIVGSLGSFFQWILGTSICESVNSAANIFLGQTEAPLLLKPYLMHLTDSELHAVMTSGFATVSGTVLAAYIHYGANPRDLITSSVMSAPAALCLSKLMYPETEEAIVTKKTVKVTKMEFDSVLDAASKGALDAHKMVVGIIASLIAFISFVFFLNGILGWLGMLVGYTEEPWSIELIVGKVFIPVSYVMGVPWDECEKVGQLIGIKTMVNEFVAFENMSKMVLRPRTKVIATYAICGFSNPASIGIQISGLGALIPDKVEPITRLVFRAFVGGALVCLMTACIAGLLI